LQEIFKDTEYWELPYFVFPKVRLSDIFTFKEINEDDVELNSQIRYNALKYLKNKFCGCTWIS